MKSLHTIQELSRLGSVLSKIAFVLSAVGFCGCAAGLLSLCFGDVGLIKIGGVTLRGLIENNAGYSSKSIAAALAGWLIVCAGEAVLARFAESYFKNELDAGTPFTAAGAKELLRLGILAIAIPVGCAVVGSIAEGILTSLMHAERAADLHFDTETSVVLGIMLLLGSLLCRHGAELAEKQESCNRTEGEKPC